MTDNEIFKNLKQAIEKDIQERVDRECLRNDIEKLEKQLEEKRDLQREFITGWGETNFGNAIHKLHTDILETLNDNS